MATELEKEMAALLGNAGQIEGGVKEAQKSAAKTRRKSRDLELMFEQMPGVEKWKGLSGLLADDTEGTIKALFADIGERRSPRARSRTRLHPCVSMLTTALRFSSSVLAFRR